MIVSVNVARNRTDRTMTMARQYRAVAMPLLSDSSFGCGLCRSRGRGVWSEKSKSSYWFGIMTKAFCTDGTEGRKAKEALCLLSFR